MSVGYRAVGWNPNKRRYDLWLVASVGLYLAAFVGISLATRPEGTAETLLIRAFGSAAFLLLHVILAIGPLCRLDRRFLPLLYNRRHMGVTMFLLALVHGVFSLIQFHALGPHNPLVSLFVSDLPGASASNVPFQPFGFVALVILFLMAATSHDFWLTNLSAPTWKRLHMLVYVAYASLVVHVAFGALQVETDPLLFGAVTAGAVLLLGLHLAAGLREKRADERAFAGGEGGWIDLCSPADIPDDRALVRVVSGERVAVFKYDGKLSAISSVCQHQNGPLGEGRVIDGCITCPWHGYQYRPEDGASPPPFEERVPTFRVRLRAGRVEVDPKPLPAGTRVEPALCNEVGRVSESDFYVGYLPDPPRRLMRFVRAAAWGVSLVALGVAALFAFSQRPLGAGVFEFGSERTFVGVARAQPVPHLVLARPAYRAGVSQYPLVAFGKAGVGPWIEELDGELLQVRGTLVYRAGMTMIEVANYERHAGEAPEVPGPVSHEPRTLEGEIVDSKCFLGVMKPGATKLHRACAINCIEGGIPPVLLVREDGREDGRAVYYLVVGSDGRALNAEVLPYVAVPIRAAGEIERHGELWVLKTEPSEWETL